MTRPANQLDIAAAAGRKTSPEHKRFQSLLAQIDKARQRLQTWQTQLPLFAEVHTQQVKPLLATLAASRRAMVFEIEAVRAGPRWTKAERNTMSEMICDIGGTLLDAGETPDDELKALFDRHSDVEYDALGEHELASMQALFEEVGGFDFGGQPVSSTDDLLQRAQAQAQLNGEREGARKPHGPHESHRAARQTPRQTAAQKRAAEDERRISQTVREVYRKLAAALHPDRAPPAMAADERAVRTARMQRANTAYEAGDLLALLELQLQIEQVDIAHAAGVATEQVRHFNKVLAEQLHELQAEVDGRQQAFCESYGLLTERRIDPDKLGPLLKEEARELGAAQLLVDMQRRALKSEPSQVKHLLKQWRTVQRMDSQYFY